MISPILLLHRYQKTCRLSHLCVIRNTRRRAVFLIAMLSRPPVFAEPTSSSNHAVLITGAGSGIGRHAALALVANGFFVFAGVRKSSDAVSLIEDAANSKLLQVALVTQNIFIKRNIRVKTPLDSTYIWKTSGTTPLHQSHARGREIKPTQL